MQITKGKFKIFGDFQVSQKYFYIGYFILPTPLCVCPLWFVTLELQIRVFCIRLSETINDQGLWRHVIAPKLLRLLRQSVVCLHLITIYVSCLFAFVYNLSELFVCICLQFKWAVYLHLFTIFVSCLFAFVYNLSQLFICICLQFKSAVCWQ